MRLLELRMEMEEVVVMVEREVAASSVVGEKKKGTMTT